MDGWTADHVQRVVRDGVREVTVAPSLEKILKLFAVHGIYRDVPSHEVTDLLGITPIRLGNHVGPYIGRLNAYQQRKGSMYRVCPGLEQNTYRLIRLA